MPKAIRPFAASRTVDYESLPVDDPPRALSCGGDFAYPGLDDEMRRFLWRDVVPVVMYAVCALHPVFAVLSPTGRADRDPLSGIALVRHVSSFVPSVIAFAGDTYAYVRHKHAAPALRMVMACVL